MKGDFSGKGNKAKVLRQSYAGIFQDQQESQCGWRKANKMKSEKRLERWGQRMEWCSEHAKPYWPREGVSILFKVISEATEWFGAKEVT